MKESFLRVVRRNGTSLAVNIPREVIDILNIKEGDVVNIEIEKRRKNK